MNCDHNYVLPYPESNATCSFRVHCRALNNDQYKEYECVMIYFNVLLSGLSRYEKKFAFVFSRNVRIKFNELLLCHMSCLR